MPALENACIELIDYTNAACALPPDGGVDTTAYFAVCAADTIGVITHDANGCIDDITMPAGAVFHPITIVKESGLAEMESTLNDNNKYDKLDRFTLQTELQDCVHHKYWKDLANPNVFIVAIIPLNSADNRYMVFGYKGGLQLQSFNWTTGNAQGDFTGFTGVFENTTRPQGVLLNANTGTYANGNEDLITAIT